MKFEKIMDCGTFVYFVEFYNKKCKSRASDREIEQAVKLLKNGGKVSLSKFDRISIIRKTVSYGSKYAVGKDAKYEEFLTEIMQGYDVDFLEDVLLCFDYSENPTGYTSANHTIGSSGYIHDYEK